MKFLKLMISVALLGCGLPLYGQQAGRAFRTLPSQCLGRPGLPPGIATALCKPALGGAQPQQASNDIVRNDDSGTFITFDVPGAVNGTYPSSINPAGNITGYYCDAITCHSFLRTRDGTITTFDPPGSTYTCCFEAINPAGTITGGYADASNASHGFVRDRDGTITTFDVPGAYTSRSQSAFAINPEGAIAGIYFLPIVGNPLGGDYRGFLRNPDGTFATFDAATYPPCCIWTFATGINPKGAITGYDNDGHNLNHGFLRDPDGTITTFDAPGAGTVTDSGQGTTPYGINPAGAIVGIYLDARNVYHGFLRARDGNFTTFDAPGAGTGNYQGTFASSINPARAITGYYTDSSGANHGYVRSQ